MDRDALIKLLLEKFDYKKSQVEETVDQLLSMDPKILEAFETWLKTGEYPELPIYCAHNPISIHKKYHLKPPAIFLMLDWMREEPMRALNALNYDYGKDYVNSNPVVPASSE